MWKQIKVQIARYKVELKQVWFLMYIKFFSDVQFFFISIGTFFFPYFSSYTKNEPINHPWL